MRKRPNWNRVGPDDEQLLERWLEIMVTMDSGYRKLDVASLCEWVQQPGAEIHYCRSGGVEIVLRLQFDVERRRYRLVSVGYLGSADAHEVVEQVFERIRRLAITHRVNRLYVWVCESNDSLHRHLHELRQSVLQHPRLQVTVLKQWPEKALWKIEERAAHRRQAARRIQLAETIY